MRFLMRLVLFLFGLVGVFLSMFAQWFIHEKSKDIYFSSPSQRVEYLIDYANGIPLSLLLVSVLVWILLAICIHRKVL